MSARDRARDLLSRLPEGKVIGAEIGVHRGDMSLKLLTRPDLYLLMVDNWKGSVNWPKGYRPQDMPDNKNKATWQTEFAGERRRIIYADSVAAAAVIDPGSLDFVFIDADHTYEAVSADIKAWRPKVRKGGLIGGHDYGKPGFPGVKIAVDEVFKEIERDRFSCWYARL